MADTGGASVPPATAPVIKFRNYTPRDQGLVGGGGVGVGARRAPEAAAAAGGAPAKPPIAVALAPLPAPSVLLAQAGAAESAAILASAKNVRARGASGGRPCRGRVRQCTRAPVWVRASARPCRGRPP